MSEKMVPTATEPNGATAHKGTRRVAPPVDIFEYESGLVVVADIPGVAKDDIDVRVENGTLTIKAHPEETPKGEPVGFEYGLPDYYRQFELGQSIDQENIRAEYKNGVLTLHLPVAEKAQPKRIAVSMS